MGSTNSPRLTTAGLYAALKGQTLRFPSLDSILSPFPTELSPHYDQLKHIVDMIIEDQIDEEEVKEKARKIDVALLAAYWYPHSPLERLETISYFLLWIFLWDDAAEESATIDLDADSTTTLNERALEYVAYHLGLDHRAFIPLPDPSPSTLPSLSTPMCRTSSPSRPSSRSSTSSSPSKSSTTAQATHPVPVAVAIVALPPSPPQSNDSTATTSNMYIDSEPEYKDQRAESIIINVEKQSQTRGTKEPPPPTKYSTFFKCFSHSFRSHSPAHSPHHLLSSTSLYLSSTSLYLSSTSLEVSTHTAGHGTIPTETEYWKYRRGTNGISFFSCLGEYMTDTVLPGKVWEMKEMRRLWDAVARNVVIINDVLSLPKEIKVNWPGLVAIYLVDRTPNMSLDKAVGILVEELKRG
ncbi:hypothetical protein B0T20DRAFT_404235 [Sordaria brevicollis]|uniref:Terpene synthase n=1 Tax=Sordaria brevicollis TaxID=83679 RepID=A0AAE0UFR3_SORBR|nr:hypothetical protein B0T20DRAFT_404235 [Sordaria brevicollis]